MNPLIDPTLTGLKEERHHFLQRIDLEIEENNNTFANYEKLKEG
jgi:hypothetical protein